MSKRRINLALQGGGAHGAFTWGVLDRLLEEPDLEIAGVSGTSAGALNAAALKSGLAQDGADGGRAALRALWEGVMRNSSAGLPEWFGAEWLSPNAVSRGVEMSWPYLASDALSRTMTPYHWGPFYSNPLKPVVESFDFSSVCASKGPELHIGATNVRTGKVKVFAGDEVTPDAILASACLPTMFKAVEIDGEAYWDGGYTGNPPLFPLFHPDLPQDIVVININPLERNEVPHTAQDIQNRVNEISFNSSLLRELRAISFVQRLLRDGAIAEGAMKDVRIHIIADDDLMNDLSVATKLVPIKSVLDKLFDAGRTACDTFLSAHNKDLGTRQSADLQAMFQ